MALKFSADGEYFAQISTDGKLRVWNTRSNTFEQEFTPDFHLTSPCTCLHFLPTTQAQNNSATPRKKKRKESPSAIVLGTSSGLLLVYSITKADLDFTINSETSEAISCLSSTDQETVYSGAEQNVIVWNLVKRAIQSKWKSGNDKITAVLALPHSNRLLTASKTIKLWNIETKEILKSYTGHSSDIILLQHVKPNRNNDEYFISGSKGDRLLCCWSLKENSKERNAAASFSMEDVVQSISIEFDEDGCTCLAVNVRSGVVHVYQHTLNGKCAKPLKPKTTIQVIADTEKSSDLVTPIRIFGVIHRDEGTLCIGYGNEILLSFENVKIGSKKLDCLIRKDPKQLAITKSDQTSKIKTPIVSNDVHYLTPHISPVSGAKRKQDGKIEIPMEQRLENLALNKLDDSKVPRSDNVAQLLLQGLHSKDQNILRTVLNKRDDNVIRNTVKRLSVAAIVPLVQELNNYIQGKTRSTQIGATWLRQILQTHASILLSNPELAELLTPALNSIQSRLSLQTPLNRLKGRLDLLVSQVSTTTNSQENEEPLLMFNDKDSSDSDEEEIELMDAHSESDNEWIEESDEDGNNEKDGVDENESSNESDIGEMSA